MCTALPKLNKFNLLLTIYQKLIKENNKKAFILCKRIKFNETYLDHTFAHWDHYSLAYSVLPVFSLPFQIVFVLYPISWTFPLYDYLIAIWCLCQCRRCSWQIEKWCPYCSAWLVFVTVFEGCLEFLKKVLVQVRG